MLGLYLDDPDSNPGGVFKSTSERLALTGYSKIKKTITTKAAVFCLQQKNKVYKYNINNKHYNNFQNTF